MDQDKARLLFREGAILLFLDVPEGTEFGIDYHTWEVGPQFRGVKMIPPGVHFVYYSARGKDGDIAPRTGFFYNFSQREIVVRKWDAQLEDIKPEYESAEELERFQSSRKEMDKFLGAYPYDSYKKWVSLSCYMTSDLVCRLQPLSGKISSVTEWESEASNTKSRKDAAVDQPDIDNSQPLTPESAEKMLPVLNTKPGTEIRFSTIPKCTYPSGASPSDITKYSMDSSYVLRTILHEYHQDNDDNILGELQFSFICFLIGHVHDAFEQWKKLVHLLCSSEEALSTHQDLFMNFISMMHFQLRKIPEDFFVDIVSRNNFLTSTLQEFFSNLESLTEGDKLRQRGLKFREHLSEKFRWDFTSEPDDFAPLVVELSQ